MSIDSNRRHSAFYAGSAAFIIAANETTSNAAQKVLTAAMQFGLPDLSLLEKQNLFQRGAFAIFLALALAKGLTYVVNGKQSQDRNVADVSVDRVFNQDHETFEAAPEVTGGIGVERPMPPPLPRPMGADVERHATATILPIDMLEAQAGGKKAARDFMAAINKEVMAEPMPESVRDCNACPAIGASALRRFELTQG